MRQRCRRLRGPDHHERQHDKHHNDIDNEHDYQIACQHFEQWYADQLRLGESRHPGLAAESRRRAGAAKGSGGSEAA